MMLSLLNPSSKILFLKLSVLIKKINGNGSLILKHLSLIYIWLSINIGNCFRIASQIPPNFMFLNHPKGKGNGITQTLMQIINYWKLKSVKYLAAFGGLDAIPCRNSGMFPSTFMAVEVARLRGPSNLFPGVKKRWFVRFD